MNRARLRELFDNAKADVRDYYDAQRDMLEAQRKLFDHLLDAATLIADDGGVIATGEGVTVMRPPEGTAMPCCRMGCEQLTAAPGDIFCKEHGEEGKPEP